MCGRIFLNVKKLTNIIVGRSNMTITICIGSSCHLKGSREVITNLEELVERNGLMNKVEMEGSFCLNQCVKGVCVKIDENIYSVTPSTTEEFFINEVLSKIK